MSRTVGKWKCALGMHLWPHRVLRRGQSETCLRCGARKVQS